MSEDSSSPPVAAVDSQSSSSALPTSPATRILPQSHPRYASIAQTMATISAECAAELREEMRAKKQDVGAVRDLLRFHIGKQLDIAAQLHLITIAEDGNDAASDYSLPDSLFLAHPLIPSSMRGAVWSLLLGSHNKDTTLLDGFDADRITQQPRAPSTLRPKGSAAQQEEEEGEDQQISSGVMTASLHASIRMDAQQTRHAMHSNPQLVNELETLLVFYCHSRSVDYRQGLGEVLASILLTMSHSTTSSASPLIDSTESLLLSGVPLSVPRGSVYNAFYALIPTSTNASIFSECIIRITIWTFPIVFDMSIDHSAYRTR